MTMMAVVGWTLLGLLAGLALWFWLLRRGDPAGTGAGHAVGLILAVGLACRLAFVYGTPLYYAPDEQSHYHYARFLAERRALPVQTCRTDDPANEWEYYQPPLYYLAAAPLQALGSRLGGEAGGIRALRVLSVALWLLTAWLALRLARILELDDFLRVFVAGLVSLLPTYLFISAMVNNDNLVPVLGGALLCLLARREGGWRGALLAGALLGLGLLTKFSAVVYLPLMALLLAPLAGGAAPARRRSAGRLLAALLVAAVLVAPWIARNLQVYGSIGAEDVANVPRQWESLPHAACWSITYMADSFWAVAGIHNDVSFWFPRLGHQLFFFALAGLLFTLAAPERRRMLLTGRLDRPFLLAMILAIAFNALLVLRFGVLYNQGQGRFLFPLLVPLALLMGLGLRVYPVKKLSLHLAGLLITYGVTFTAFALAMFTRV
ncbi:MAG: glycosyltransferase family 39 protein [Candidatus Krumholzibacteriota bacterium]|nr:glycosyltransferase family 39 protein [Candidatus Krumholzibacteriota bacterium]